MYVLLHGSGKRQAFEVCLDRILLVVAIHQDHGLEPFQRNIQKMPCGVDQGGA